MLLHNVGFSFPHCLAMNFVIWWNYSANMVRGFSCDMNILNFYCILWLYLDYFAPLQYYAWPSPICFWTCFGWLSTFLEQYLLFVVGRKPCELVNWRKRFWSYSWQLAKMKCFHSLRHWISSILSSLYFLPVSHILTFPSSCLFSKFGP